MFESNTYEVRQQLSVGNKYTIYEDGEQILSSAQKKFTLKEDFRFVDPDTDEEVFQVTTDQVLDLNAAYTIVDQRTDETIGAVKRSSVSSFIKHEYKLLDADGRLVGYVSEDSWLMAFLRRNVTGLLPFNYTITDAEGTTDLGDVDGQFSLRDTYEITLRDDADLDPRLAVIATVLIDALEAN